MLIMPDNTLFTPVTDPNMQENRTDAKHIDMELRYHTFEEVEKTYTKEEADNEAARCLQCPTHWCQKECPAGVPVTEFIGKVQKGDLEGAYQLIRTASNLPEICSRVCPQDKQCQSNCTRSIRNEAVGIGRLERYVVEQHYANGIPEPSAPSTGKKVAIIGSGPAGLSAAQSLISAGHAVSVYERADRIGGLLEYGIPNMKLDKGIVARKAESLSQQGVNFILNTNVGVDITAEELLSEYDAVLLTVGTGSARTLDLNGAKEKGIKGIYPAVAFLASNTKSLLDSDLKDGKNISAEGKNVVIIGGGDTGNDCLGTSLRTGALSVTQIEMLPQSVGREIVILSRTQRPKEKKVDTSQEEFRTKFQKDPHIYQTTVKEVLVDEKLNPTAVVTVDLKPVYDDHFRLKMEEIPGSEKELPCELLIIAAGFIGPEAYIADSFSVETDARSNIKTNHYSTNIDKLFACGDCRTGQSLVVKAMVDGRDCAKAVNDYLKEC
jgi:glutamate synthase (NADPH) small chain